MFSLLKPTVSLLLRPYVFTVVLHSTTERSPTDQLLIPRFRRHALVPYIFGAESLDQ